MRVIFILSAPVDITTLTRDPLDGPKIWESKVKALGAMLGVQHDTACEDPSRFFFGARHPEGAKWRTVVFRGRPLVFDQIVTDADNPFSQAGGGFNGGVSTIPEVAVDLPDGTNVDVTALYRRYGMQAGAEQQCTPGTTPQTRRPDRNKKETSCAFKISSL